MIPPRPDLPFVLRTLQDLLTKIGVPRAFLVLAKTMRKVVLVDKESSMANHVETLAISGAETLYINTEFWKKQVLSQYDMNFVLLHELFHHILGDTGILNQRKNENRQVEEDLEGVSTDARINSLIFQFLPRDKKSGDWICSRMYKPNGLHGLLRPWSSYSTGDPLKSLYYNLWKGGSGMQSHEDVLNALRLLYNHQNVNISLIGGHGATGSGGTQITQEGQKAKEQGEGQGESPLKPMPKEVLSVLGEAINEAGQEAGYGDYALKKLVSLVNHSKQLDKRVLKSYSVTHQLNKLRSMFPKKRRSRKPVPINPTNRDLLKMILNGYPPILWNSPKTRNEKAEFGVAIYLDLSGSVWEYLPKILRVLSSMKRELKVIYGFSNQVHEHTLNQLRRGELTTTGGTDFDCIAKHLLENKFDRCVIITDGYASIGYKNQAKIKKQVKKCGMILFGENDNANNWFSNNYDNYYLNDIVT
jgi:hypothetical protein|tara:strand:- start:2397 stop:3815 length:1419 start_codon:yes stop_codon:yes gene_type:complete